MSPHDKKADRLRNTLQPLLAPAANSVDRMPETVRRQCLDLLAEVLVAIVRAESNPTDASNL